jgi:hypothetical protein
MLGKDLFFVRVICAKQDSHKMEYGHSKKMEYG